MRTRLVLLVCGAFWVAGISYGMTALSRYSTTAATPASAPAQWPASSRLPRVDGQPTLVLLAHPRCPCTRATISELNAVMSSAGAKPQAFVLFLRPEGMAEGWEKTDLWRSAERIPGVRVLADAAGVETSRFGAAASGQTLFYDAGGRLQFAGGITRSRGHQGDNPGRRALEALLRGDGAPQGASAVYGCSLVEPSQVEENEEDDG